MKRMWSIGERIFKDNFEKRMKMFNSLMESPVWRGNVGQDDNRLDGIKKICEMDSKTGQENA